MRIAVNGIDTFVATGGKPFDPALPAIVFIHGAGLDRSLWALYSRWFAHNGWAVLVPDLPGHGLSGGKPLESIAAMADWVAALIAAAGATNARLVGHSMGSLIAIEAAARHPERVTGLALVAAAAAMPVSEALLAAAKNNSPDAIAMMTVWGFGHRAGFGGSLLSGNWMMGKATRILEAAKPGVLFTDLAASNGYDGSAAAAKIRVPVKLVLGERDLMTPARSGKALAAMIPGAETVVLAGAGHMLLPERPDEVLAALR